VEPGLDVHRALNAQARPIVRTVRAPASGESLSSAEVGVGELARPLLLERAGRQGPLTQTQESTMKIRTQVRAGGDPDEDDTRTVNRR
jgi:hypothetical protein